MRNATIIEKYWQVISILALLVLLLYSMGYLFAVPYLGIDIYSMTGEVLAIIEEPLAAETLHEGDKLHAVNGVAWRNYLGYPDRLQPLFAEYPQGESIPFTVRRNEEILSINWALQGPNVGEVFSRVLGLWWVAFIYWGFGVLTLLALQPKDERWRLMMGFSYLAAVWIILLYVSLSQLWFSMALLVTITWLLAAWFLRLHWIFPRPLGASPKWMVWGLYGASIVLAAAQLMQWLPWYAHFVALLLAVTGSIGFLLIHYWRQPELRWETRPLLAALLVVTLGSGIFVWLGYWSGWLYIIYGGLILTPMIPAAYFYVVSRRRLGRWEGLLNQAGVVLVFACLLLAFILAVEALIFGAIDDPYALVVASSGTVVLSGGIGLMLYRPFKRWFEGRFLGIQLPTEALMQDYSEKLVTQLRIEELVDLLRNRVLPGLRIRQGVLLSFHGFDGMAPPQQIEVICQLNLEPGMLPTPKEAFSLLNELGCYRFPPEDGVLSLPCSWVRLALPLKREGRIFGLCLFGQRLPDDFYSQNELPTLRTLVDQTALALTNIEQARMLLELSRRSIAHREAERRSLAHELHDEVLAQMAVLAQSMAEPSLAFVQAYQDAVQRIRDVISGLRPATLEQLGLHTALEELLDDLTERGELMDACPMLGLDLTPERRRYHRDVELHLYRIVQQASYNVLKHAEAENLVIRGQLEQDSVSLEVIDDGVGFADGNHPDLRELLARQHFGLVTMYERASLIGARVEIESAPGEGTRVKIVWRQGQSES